MSVHFTLVETKKRALFYYIDYPLTRYLVDMCLTKAPTKVLSNQKVKKQWIRDWLKDEAATTWKEDAASLLKVLTLHYR